MKQRAGFTVIELMLAIVVIGVIAILLFVQKNTLDQTTRDNQRKTAINAMYYSLENSYYAQHKSYPNHLNSGVLTTMDPELFADPFGVKIGEADSDYRYLPTDCNGDKCKSYTLRADLEREDDYVKSSPER